MSDASYIIFTLSFFVLSMSLLSLGKINTNINIPFINETNIHIYIIASLFIGFVSFTYILWSRDVDTLCKKK